jgi:hypothetical protein
MSICILERLLDTSTVGPQSSHPPRIACRSKGILAMENLRAPQVGATRASLTSFSSEPFLTCAVQELSYRPWSKKLFERWRIRSGNRNGVRTWSCDVLPSSAFHMKEIRRCPHSKESCFQHLRYTLCRPWSKNPFSMPADEEVFKLREVEKRHKLEQREAVKRMHVHEKTTFASRMGTSLASEAVANVGYVTPCQLLVPFFFNLSFYPFSGCKISLNDPSRSLRTRRTAWPVIARLGGHGQCPCDYSTQAAFVPLFPSALFPPLGSALVAIRLNI